MIRMFRKQAARVCLAGSLAGVALGAALPWPALAARVEGLYAATVPVQDSSAEALQSAYAEALRRVLVKVTGRREAGASAQLASQFGDPQRFVQQFRRDATGGLWAQFDPAAIRRGLDAAGQPIWGEDRPTTLVWLAFDSGAGERDILGSEAPAAAGADRLRQDLLRSAEERGVPLLLPLRDSQDLAAVAFADVWGEYSERVLAASRRYQAEAVLVGRARLYPAGMPDVRWTAHLGDERLEWRGSVADGPSGLADRLAARLATAAASDQHVLLAVTGIASLDGYGQVTGYLRTLGPVEALEVPFVKGDAVVYRLRVRGGREQLVQSLALSRLLRPDAAGPGELPLAGRAPDLAYRLAVAP